MRTRPTDIRFWARASIGWVTHLGRTEALMHVRSFVNEGRLSEIEKQAAFKLRIVNKAEYAGYAV